VPEQRREEVVRGERGPQIARQELRLDCGEIYRESRHKVQDEQLTLGTRVTQPLARHNVLRSLANVAVEQVHENVEHLQIEIGRVGGTRLVRVTRLQSTHAQTVQHLKDHR
jgi:hypothetical protein